MSDQIQQKDINNAAWAACDTFRGVMDAAGYKDYILVMLFLDPTAEYDRKASPLVGDDFQGYFVRLFYVSYPRSNCLALIAAIGPQVA